MLDDKTPDTKTERVNPIMKYFGYAESPSLPSQEINKIFGDLARHLDHMIPDNQEKSAGFRKLIEARDCMVRARLPV